MQVNITTPASNSQYQNGKYWLKTLIFFYDLDLQIVKVDSLDEIILMESRLGVAFEFCDGLVQPDGFSQIELIACLFQGPEYFVGPGVIAVVCNYGIPKQMIVFQFFYP